MILMLKRQREVVLMIIKDKKGTTKSPAFKRIDFRKWGKDETYRLCDPG